jgi:two-component system, sensor histidine kinase
MRRFTLISTLPRNFFSFKGPMGSANLIAIALAPAATPDRSREIHYDQIVSVYREYPSGMIPSILGGTLLVIIMWQQLPHTSLLLWLSALYTIVATRGYFCIRFMRAIPPIDQIDKWRKIFMVGSAAAGCVWGSTAFIMFTPDSLIFQWVILTSLFGVCAGGVSVLGYYLPAFYVFAIPLVAPIIVRQIIIEGTIHLVVAAICALFLVSFLGFARRHNRLSTESFRMRYENSDLIGQLQQQTLAAKSASLEAERAKKEAERAKEEAELANRAKSQFLATASHDLRQPLQAIALFSEALRERIYYPEVRSIVDNINASVEALQSLFNELLDISRLEAGVVQAMPIHFRANQLFDKLRTDYTPTAREKGLRLRVVPSDLALFTDPILLERVVRNFVSNAVRYTDEGGAVIVGCRRQRDGKIRIEVRDNGVGIAQGEQQKIFEEFYQVENPERDRRKGFGLGLAIARGIENIINCKIKLRSAQGKGSIFSIAVPRGTPLAEPSAISSNIKKQVKNLRGAFVVVLEDDHTVREAMQMLLYDWGCEVIAEATVEEALARIREAARFPSLVIADYRLRGGLNGIEAITRIRALTKQSLPALLVTGDTGAERLREVRESGITLLHKPVVISQLSDTLSRLIAQSA